MNCSPIRPNDADPDTNMREELAKYYTMHDNCNFMHI